MSVTIHGIECKNCFDVDWARRVEAEDKKKDEAEAARKAKEAIAPSGSAPDIISGVDQTSAFDNRPAVLFDGALKKSATADAAAVAAVARANATRPTVNLVV
jgi:hypothetical protein